jgi:formate dehydrogenase
MEASKRGAKIRFVNPRVTESSDSRTGPTLQIVPDTDAYLLAAMICEIDRSVGFHRAVGQHGRHVGELRNLVRQYPPERVAPVCGVTAEEIIELAREFATANSAAAHMSTGVNQGRQGTLAYWLLHMLVFVTGNLDRRGGNIASRGYYDIVARGRSDYERGFVDTEFGTVRAGEIPGGLFTRYVLEAKEPVRALFVIGGNPLLSMPGQHAIEAAFRALELLVVIDIYPTATAEHADWLLPATDQFERGDIGVTGLSMQARPWVQFTAPVATPQHERREEWWMFARLAQQLGLKSALDNENPDETKWSKVDHMLSETGITRAQLLEQPRGLPLGDELEPGSFYDSTIQTADGRVDCCPAAFASTLDRFEQIFQEFLTAPSEQIRLISRRDSRMHNSWYANVAGMKRGDRNENRLAINHADAARLGVANRQKVRVRSAWGSLEVTAELDDKLRVGVVSLEHGWGLQASLRNSRTAPGVNVNAILPHGDGSYERLSNQQYMTGVPVRIELVGEKPGEVTHG